MAGDGIEPSTSRFSVARSYQLSYPAEEKQKAIATQTGLEPATSAVTGRRANQLRYWANRSPMKFPPMNSRPQRDSNPCYRRERAMSWAPRRWGLEGSRILSRILILDFVGTIRSYASIMRKYREKTQHLGPLAQSVEQRTFNPWVVGSIPTGPTFHPRYLQNAKRHTHNPTLRKMCAWTCLVMTDICHTF